MRDSWDKHYMDMAQLVATRSTCARRSVGCVLVDKWNRVLATGFNGVPPGWPHCNEGNPCPGAQAPSGTDLDLCYANHAEANALIQCPDIQKIHTCYVTVSPCVTCTKHLLCTWCSRVVFLEKYPHHDARDMWIRRSNHMISREWIQLLSLEATR